MHNIQFGKWLKILSNRYFTLRTLTVFDTSFSFWCTKSRRWVLEKSRTLHACAEMEKGNAEKKPRRRFILLRKYHPTNDELLWRNRKTNRLSGESWHAMPGLRWTFGVLWRCKRDFGLSQASGSGREAIHTNSEWNFEKDPDVDEINLMSVKEEVTVVRNLKTESLRTASINWRFVNCKCDNSSVVY